MKIKVDRSLLLITVFIIIFSLVYKFYGYQFLPAKYFYDANHILRLMKLNDIVDVDLSYGFTANFFNFINIFKFTTLMDWSIFISIIFLPILIRIIWCEKKYSLIQYIYILFSVVLINIFVFGISKDIIQFIFFLIIYLILKSKKLTNIKKIFFASIVLLLEALNFRIYYAIMAMIFVTIYYVYKVYIENRKLGKRKFSRILTLSLLLFFFEVFVVQLLSDSNYNSILNARYSVNIWRVNDVDARTIINDLLGKNKNYLVFIGNYIINSFRMLFPFELVFKGVKQIIFAVYQFFVSFSLIKSCRKINNDNCLWIIMAISFFMMSIIFEPDFGSFVRHESAFFVILLEVVKISFGGEESEKNK